MTKRAFVLAIGALVVAPAALCASEGPEVWAEYKVAGAVSDAVTFRTSSAARYSGDPLEHYYTHMEIGFDWKAASYATVGAYYQHVNTSSGAAWAVENRPHLDVTLALTLRWLRLSDRQRFEWRVIGGDGSLRYRNKLTASPQTSLWGLVKPYAAFEPFVDLSEGELVKSRAYAGAEVTLYGPFAADVYYAYEGWKESGDGTGILGLAFKQRF